MSATMTTSNNTNDSFKEKMKKLSGIVKFVEDDGSNGEVKEFMLLHPSYLSQMHAACGGRPTYNRQIRLEYQRLFPKDIDGTATGKVLAPHIACGDGINLYMVYEPLTASEKKAKKENDKQTKKKYFQQSKANAAAAAAMTDESLTTFEEHTDESLKTTEDGTFWDDPEIQEMLALAGLDDDFLATWRNC